MKQHALEGLLEEPELRLTDLYDTDSNHADRGILPRASGTCTLCWSLKRAQRLFEGVTRGPENVIEGVGGVRNLVFV